MPTEHDDRMLFLGPKATLAIATQVELAAWARDVNNRSASSAEELANPAYPQQTLQHVLTKTAQKLPATQDRSPASGVHIPDRHTYRQDLASSAAQ